MRARLAALRPLLRLARRDALRARGRSALIVAMIALPVLALTFTDVLVRTQQADPDEAAVRTLGRAQYVLQGAAAAGAGLQQAPDPARGTTTTAAVDGPVADPLQAVPRGARALTSSSSFAQVTVRTSTGVGLVGYTEVDAADPLLRGRYAAVRGAAPRRDDEVLVTPALLTRTGLHVGDELVLEEPAARLRIVGTTHELGQGDRTTEAYALPGTLVGAPGGISRSEVTTSVFVGGTSDLTWPQVRALNARGITAYARAVVLHPPPRAAVPYYLSAGTTGSDTAFLLLLGLVVVGLAGLEVVLLAGAAFAVGARRQTRSLALLAAGGADRRQVRAVVLSGGLVLGAVAAAVGVVGGAAAAAAARPLLTRWTGQEFARFDLRWTELAPMALLGVVTGVLAAVLPARGAARRDVVAALAGRRGEVATPRRVPLIGVVVALVGVTVAGGGSLLIALVGQRSLSTANALVIAALIAGGASLTVIGLIVCSPAVIGSVGRLGKHLPLAPRLAVRDAARHRGRSAPATAAVLAAVSGSAALLLFVASQDDREHRAYTPDLPSGTAGVSLETFDARGNGAQRAMLDPDAVRRLVAAHLPVADAVVARGFRDCSQAGCSAVQVVSGREDASGPRSSYTQRFSNSGVVVGGADDLADLYGVTSPAARRVLDAGGAVTFAASDLVGDHVTLTTQDGADVGAGRTTTTARIEVPAIHLPGGDGQTTLLSPAAARRLPATVEQTYLLLRLGGTASRGDEDAAALALRDRDVGASLVVERGYQGQYRVGLLALVIGAGLITLGAAGIATGLAQADARADYATLAAVGAAPRLRRDLAGFQALTVAGLGAAMGIAAGFVPAVAIIAAVDSYRLVLPWVPLGAVLVGVPLLAGALAWLLTRSRLPLERRVAA